MGTLWPYLGTMALLAALAWFAWRRRNVPGARPFAIACLFSSLWVGGSAATLAAADPPAKLARFKFQSVWQIRALTAAVCFAGVRPARPLAKPP